jgi:DNA-binding protein
MATDEINVSSTRGIGFVVSEAAKALESKGRVTLCGINFAMPRLVQAVELLKHSLKGLHQVNSFERIADSSKTRLSVTLSLSEVDSRTKGYQEPLPLSKVTERPISEIAKVPERKPRTERRPEGTLGLTTEEESKGPRGPPRRSRRGGFRGRSRFGGRGASRGNSEGRSRSAPRGRRPDGPRSREAIGEEKYTRVPRKIEEEKLEDNEIRITAKLPVEATVHRAVVLFKRLNASSVTLKATGSAIPQAVAIAEAIRRGVAGLHQLTEVSRQEVTDVFKAREEGLTDISKTRQVPILDIVLSKASVDTSHYGYQAPLSADKVKEISVEVAERTS